ncbi:hypothetical protein SASPL_111417 [Salvia splendens]|uniref:WRKY domain-containing protein n=1 Tax=Salvia splendens TaxID=180675 RepID=A0A8X8YAQ3_SALSN|nr:hypothetical protein SASPL_111417 [Salvia splendens]
MEEDWDLHAVVRGCATTTAPVSTNNAVSFQPLYTHQQDFSVSCFEDLSPNGVVHEELHDLYKPFFPNSLSLFLMAQKLVHVWSWRKYGQKPIKGSPYPRGYYRCSTSKGCLARKQVERNRSDPGMFIVAYTAEHNHPMPTHRNSLAGSTRHKPADVPTKDSLSPEKLESSREDDLAEADDDDDAVFSVSDDDFFAGLEDFTAASPDVGHLQFPWLSTTATATTTTTAGGS